MSSIWVSAELFGGEGLMNGALQALSLEGTG